MICLREPSLGPVFGMKGGAAGGGRAQVVPMEDINLHFTGDFNAIALANNLLAALIDNHVHHGNALGIDVRRVTWKRVVDMNDRALRDITVPSAVRATASRDRMGSTSWWRRRSWRSSAWRPIWKTSRNALAESWSAYTRDKEPIRASDLNAEGAMTVLLKDALAPNLVQTLDGTPAFVHGGPFANIAHGCNSVIATTGGLRLADYVVTEAGFGADLGAEKFIDITCRSAGIRPSAAVIVATVRALKFHGGADAKNLTDEDLDALKAGMVNLERHIANVRDHYGVPPIVSINRFVSDTQAELDQLRSHVESLGVPIVLADHWAEGGAGAADLARVVVEICDADDKPVNVPHGSFVYPDDATLWEKIESIATTIYGASEVTADAKVRTRLRELAEEGYGNLPVCIAKTQYSFSTDPSLRGAPSGHSMNIREVRLSAGAGFIVVVCGDIMTMPGLPKVPSSERIDVR